MSISTHTTVGFDLGYGNAKIVGQRAGSSEVDVIVMPVGAAPIGSAPRTVNGKPDLRGGEAVLINGESWVAGIDPLALQGFARQTHEGYTETNEYLALFYAGLARLGYTEIDCLVTGLPCNHCLGPHSAEHKAGMVRRLRGEHFIHQSLRVDVKHVSVIPQPTGAFTALREEEPELSERPDMMCLVVDVGFYSVDYVLMHGDSLRHASSGTSLHASSSILSEAARAVSERHGIPVTPSRLETSMRRGETSIFIGGETINVAPHVEAAAATAGRHVVSELASALRSEGNAIDKVLLTGGGARWLEKALRDHYGSKRVVLGRDPVLANARGYQALARRAAGLLASAAA